MFSVKEYNDLQKAKKNAEYLEMISQSLEEAEKGGFIVKSIAELEAME